MHAEKMRFLKIYYIAFATLALFTISSAVADEVVVAFTDQNFDKVVGQDRDALIEFYAPWCGHCKKLAPEFEKLGSSFKKSESVLIGKVDCDEQKETCNKFGVSGYPTIQWFPKGSLEPKTYEGTHTAEALVDFVNSEGGANVKIAAVPSSVVVLNSDNFDGIVLDKTKDVLVEFYASWCGHCKSLAPIYEKVASAFNKEEDVVIANIDADIHKDIGEKYGVSGFPTLKFFPKGKKAEEEYYGGRDLHELMTFINERRATSQDGRGQLTSKADVVATLDNLVKEFASAGNDEKIAAFAHLQEEVMKLEGPDSRYGRIYLKSAKSFMDKGADYAKNEIQQLDHVLAKSTGAVEVDEFTLKKNILSAFA
ncbi:hypothetical protein ACET3Z_026465 [Daucus carota]